MEKEYIVYFEVFGKKMKTTVYANSEAEAKKKVLDAVVFHKVTEGDKDFNDLAGIINNWLNS